MRKILNIGQCGFDHSMIARTLTEAAGAKVDGVATASAALEALGRGTFDLILVNRILDGDGSSGLAFIKGLKKAGNQTPVMLVSNYADAQASAIAEGALPGFGKSQLGDPAIGQQIKSVLEAKQSA